MSSLLFNFLFDFFLFCFPVLFIARNKKKFELKKILAELGIKNPAPGFFFKKTTILFLQLFAVSIALSIAFFAIGFNDTQSVFEAISAIKMQNIFLLFYLLFVRVAGEEVFFRGFLTAKIGIIPSSALFGLAHVFYGSIAEVIGAFFLGLILSRAFVKNKNLMPNIFAHIFYNFFVLIIAFSFGA